MGNKGLMMTVSDKIVTANPHLKRLLSTLSVEDGFEIGAKKLADYFNETDGLINPADSVEEIFRYSSNTELLEYVLFCFLDIRHSGMDTARVTFALNHIRHLFAQMQMASPDVTDNEIELFKELQDTFKLFSVDDITRCSDDAWFDFEQIVDGAEINTKRRKRLVLLIRSEASALRERIELISSRVDAYDIRVLSRILPFFTACDRLLKEQNELAVAIESNSIVCRKIMSFECGMKPHVFRKWMETIEKHPHLTNFSYAFSLQKQKMVPTFRLAANTTLKRRSVNSELLHPTDSIIAVLESCTTDRFIIESNRKKLPSVQPTSHPSENKKLLAEPKIFGDFRIQSFFQWTNTNENDKIDDSVDTTKDVADNETHSEAMSFFENGIKAVRKKAYSEALQYFQNAVELDSDNKMYKANLNRVKMLLVQNDA